ncbi:drug/metabolite transporter (DMT)-like permease [Planomicrobium stackebrandtii]|uniref:Drug/metabolite transporter (DMT)-like permease n=1 Tax=Planomicrobium stackebrandtii TaxID=253160 RepID=A0ABU0GXX1_9BACL|nr:DMT family transporter [Planomicrobium stackebrandtii]MDQ0430153.1 drug/metabolite transporter (DMT)-like permease [Planomicrobium stackebrandtii]
MKEKLIFSFLVILTTGLMGSSFVVAKIGLIHVSPLLLAGTRFTIAGGIMIVFVLLFKRKHPKTAVEWGKVVVIGAVQTAGVMGAIFLSLRTITSGESAILTFMNPLLVVIFGTLALGMRYRLIQWIGVIIGFLGVFVTMGSQLGIGIGTLFGFSSAVFWAVGTLLIKRWGVSIDMWVLTAYQMLFGGIILLVGSALLENAYFVVNSTSLSILLWLTIPASIVQFTIWFHLLQKGDSGKVSAFLFLAPFFGIVSGWLVLGEEIGLPLLIGGSLIFAGIFLVNWPEKRIAVKVTV